MTVPKQVLDAWQSALAAEHAAVYGYSVAGPRLSDADAAAADSDQQAHIALRDATSTALLAAGATPVAPEADYPFAAGAAAAARALCLLLEVDAAQAWRFLLAQCVGAGAVRSQVGAAPVRTAAQTALTASAVRAVRWRRLVTPSAPSAPFPGI